MTKEDFINAIGVLRRQSGADDNFQEHMEAAFPGSCFAPIYINYLWDLSLSLLEDLMEDKQENITWWVYDTVFGTDTDVATISLTIEGKEQKITLDSADKLYDFLTDRDQMIP